VIRLGMNCRDLVTGYEGIVTARFEYLTGCERYELQAPGLHDGKLREACVFDAGRLIVLDSGISPGGPPPTPPRNRAAAPTQRDHIWKEPRQP